MGDKKTIQIGEMVLEIGEEEISGIYANLVIINHSPDDFILDFAFADPATRTARVRTRVILSASHCKRFYQALKANIERYESTFGPIPTPQPVGGKETEIH
jgi:hypothetical protein